MYEFNEIDAMIDAIGMAMDEHGIKRADGHWMTNEELVELPDEEVIALFNQVYGRN